MGKRNRAGEGPARPSRGLLRMLYIAVIVVALVTVVAAVLGGVAALPVMLILAIFLAVGYALFSGRGIGRPPDSRA